MRAVVVIAVVVAAMLALSSAAGRALVVADPLPQSADAIVILAGSIRDRALEAAALYRAGIAPRIVVTREALPSGQTALAAMGVELPEADALTRTALMGLGVPPRAIVTLRRRAQSTATEARTIARWACRHGMRSLVVVTSPSHTRRARLVLGRSLGPTIALAVRPARADAFASRRWLHVRRDAKVVLSEWQKLANHWLVERWILEPCGGLERRSLGTATDRKRDQAGLAAARTSAASSPLACISRTISQPPMNFPPTNTCGIVGHLV
jgi:uncharacterized SAM-binding protein YcdF (DUF218 family)